MPEANNDTSIAVLLPCYNEEVTIGKVVRDFKNSLPDATIYVYDNNSTDHTAEIAEAEGAIVRREPRQGKGNVIRAMFEDIDADVYVMADGDDTYPADAAPAMVAKVLEGYDMVIGDRLSSTYFQENKRPFHNFGNRLVRGSINHLFRAHVTDIMTGYRAFSFTFVKTYPVLSRGFEVETEMTIHSLNNNLRLYEMPIQYRDRPEGSVSKLDTVGDGIKVMSTIFRMIREYKPLPFFGGLGLIIGIVGIVLCGTVTFEFAKTGVVTHFPTLIGAVMLVITGLLLIIAGIILDVMAKNDRKTFVIDTNKIAYTKRH
ncbi:glycosyltransferase family 2 protein [Bifidobacterium longum]|uniref:glycosyltransferase family 2 protein n=1 Tax=Bifidobacterium longum TaxID=216816 RepID=UPI00174686D6|nr:glycosyltransferase family 2 protein [Bifidobacterium longum]MBD3900592.1 glycosyltransferase [Bifidobacterium longum subsp. longum]MBV4124913.1 glycosyltransferase family 2 protein [Bifidobacterium longum]MBV4133944.1 glycosyltransferase family 2 protein [Bifidobacterium longum]MBV4149148.1 glycosyltransferase family 2 protein [Bifidobacterium longum]MBV4161385.1 glycosyltransferase family 2 protein [Bifidobacterium longum]